MNKETKDINKMRIVGKVVYLDHEIKQTGFGREYVQASVVSTKPGYNGREPKEVRHTVEVSGREQAEKFLHAVRREDTVDIVGQVRPTKYENETEKRHSYIVNVDDYKVVSKETPHKNSHQIEGTVARDAVHQGNSNGFSRLYFSVKTVDGQYMKEGVPTERFSFHNINVTNPRQVEAMKNLSAGTRVSLEGEVQRFEQRGVNEQRQETIKSGFNIKANRIDILLPEKDQNKSLSQAVASGNVAAIENTMKQEVETGKLPKRALEEAQMAKGLKSKKMTQEAPLPGGM